MPLIPPVSLVVLEGAGLDGDAELVAAAEPLAVEALPSPAAELTGVAELVPEGALADAGLPVTGAVVAAPTVGELETATVAVPRTLAAFLPLRSADGRPESADVAVAADAQAVAC